MNPGRRGIAYTTADKDYFAKRGLQKYAGVWSLWALGVGAVISGHYSGWNLGLASGGWGGMFVATVVIAVMYLGLTFSIAEMSPALPHTGAAYSFARTEMGPWGGFITGLCENVEYVLTPAVIVFFIGSYLTGIFETSTSFQPIWWIGGYIIFVGLNVVGVELSFKVTVAVTLAALAVLATFWAMAIPEVEFARWALNIDADGKLLEAGYGDFLPMGIGGALAALPFAVWLFLAIEQLPLAAEESIDPQRDMPRGIILGMLTLLVSAFLILFLNPSLPGVGSHALGQSGEPLLDGFKALFGKGIGTGRNRRANFEFPYDYLRAGPANLFAIARRLFPDNSFGDTRHPQDTTCSHGRRRHCGPVNHAGDFPVVRRRGGRGRYWRDTSEHGCVWRHVFLHCPGYIVCASSQSSFGHAPPIQEPIRQTGGMDYGRDRVSHDILSAQ